MIADKKRSLPPWQGRLLIVSGPKLEPRPKTLEVTEHSRAREPAQGHVPAVGPSKKKFTSSTWWSTSCRPQTSCQRSSESSTCCCSSWPWRLTSFLERQIYG